MRRVALLYNPLSGRRLEHRRADVEAVAKVLRSAGVEVATIAPTRAAADATGQVREAMAAGCDTIFACGGDGTIHDVLQGLIGSQAALGIIPMGTANALAHDLGIPLAPAAAARAALDARPRRIAVGSLEHVDFKGKTSSCYFTVAAGVGVDAHLFYQLNGFLKGQLGMASYYAKACQLWLTHRMRRFAVEYRENGVQETQSAVLTELLAVRIRYFGGILRELAPGADLERNDLRLVLCRTASRSRYLSYVLRGMLGARRNVPGIDLAYSDRLTCGFLPSGGGGDQKRVYVEADGELLGVLPATISVLADALTILTPLK